MTIWQHFLTLWRRDGSASMSWMAQDEAVLQYKHPPLENENAHRFRLTQLQHRRQEVSSIIDLFTDKHNELAENLFKGTSGREAALREDLIRDAIVELRNRLNHDEIIMAGHSFGAATGIYSAQKDDRIKAILSFDPWLYPLPHDFTLNNNMKRAMPIISINSETFHWPGNKETLKAVLENNHELCKSNRQMMMCPSMQITVRGAGHMDQSDFCVVVPSWILDRYRPRLAMEDPTAILQINTSLAKAFVDGVIGRQIDELGPYEKLLWDKNAAWNEHKEIRADVWLVDV